MTTTLSDAVVAAEGAAEGGGRPPAVTDSPVDARSRIARDARARARIPVTQSVGKTFAFDVSRAWVWRVAPPSLKQVRDGVVPDPDLVPAGAPPLRAGWVVWNVAVAVPATAVLYVLAWLLQHPARAAILAVLAGPIGIMWITTK
jgi:hypothetical protein